MSNTRGFLAAAAVTLFGAATVPSATFAQTIDDDLICNGCVNANDIASQAVTSRALRSNSITTSKIPNGAVTFDKLESALHARIDALEATIHKLGETAFEIVDADGTVLGVPAPASGFSIGTIFSSTGYAFALGASESSSPYLSRQPLYFESNDCSGPARLEMGSLAAALAYWGYVFSDFHGAQYYVRQRTNDVGQLLMRSTLDNSLTCRAVGTDPVTVAVLPNDPSITGVPNEQIPGPISLRRLSGAVIPSPGT